MATDSRPFCGSCGWDATRKDLRADLICDSCGADLTRFGFVPPFPATGATEGMPGVFTPPGCVVPADISAMAGIVADPATVWTVGNYVITLDTNSAYWDGAAWQVGTSP